MKPFNLLKASASQVTPLFEVAEAPTSPTCQTGLRRFYVKARYPEKGRCYNSTCVVRVYVLQGKVGYETPDGHVVLNEGDTIEIPKDEHHAWIPVAPGEEAMLLTFAHPAWYPVQHVVKPDEL